MRVSCSRCLTVREEYVTVCQSCGSVMVPTPIVAALLIELVDNKDITKGESE